MSGPFKMKNQNLASSAKYKTPINYGSPTNTSPAKQSQTGQTKFNSMAGAGWVIGADGNKKYKEGSMRHKDDQIIALNLDKDKHGGPGTENKEQQKQLNKAMVRKNNEEVEAMSKAELLKASGKKTNIINKIFSNKGNLKRELKLENVRNKNKSEEPSQVMSQETKIGMGGDEYTGVTREKEENAPTPYASPAKDKQTKTVNVEHTHKKKSNVKKSGARNMRKGTGFSGNF
tara:strand:+ start:1319 stop:2011 length:693 start_codon:yes stop_codon:yes gene_type:complete